MVLRKMDVRCSIFKLLLFLILVTRCSAKYINVNMPKVEYVTSGVEEKVQDSIRDFIHTGIYSHAHLDPSQAQVVTPVKVTRDGRLVSLALEHAHEHGHARARRDVRGTEHRMPHAVHYNLTVDGRDLRLDLRPSVSFITPALVVERQSAGSRTRHWPVAEATACHYTGSVRGQPDSKIALSACDGLAGFLRTEHGEYWIEPSNQIPTDDSSGRPHVVFKRSAVDKVEAYHRAKRAVETNNADNQYRRLYEREFQKFHPRRNQNTTRNQNLRRNHDSRQSAERRMRENERLRQFEAARKSPIAYRAEMQRRADQRINSANSRSAEMQRRAEQRINSANSRSAEMQRRAEQRINSANSRSAEMLRRAEQRINSANSRSAEMQRRADQRINSANSRIAEMQRRAEQRINSANSRSNSMETSNSPRSNSMETSRSTEQNSNARNIARNKFRNQNRRRGGIKKHRRRRRRARNCATKQPPYNWNVTSASGQSYGQNRNNHPNTNRRFNSNASRRTRSVSKPQHVEVLLVADRSMTRFHKDKNLDTYLLTIMNMVSSLYMDPSIGNLIQVVVVKIILVEDSNAASDLQVTTNADTTLSSFCRWQQLQNPRNDSHPQHHDVAILVTRQDICSLHNQPCSTLGVAHVAGMCIPDRSCSVNEDNGIMLAHTITHELGHNFGLYHDTEKIGCSRREGSTLHIMTPVFEADSVQVAWSRCSKRDVTNFLDNGLGECLGDEPSDQIHNEYKYPEVPAGVTFDATTQCVLQFGIGATMCTDPTELCEHLWCLVNDTCKTMLRPAAPGTTCGDNMWCQNQRCVPRESPPEARNGGWGEWSPWSECSRTCGGGVETQTRECNNPMPSNNGKYCVGDRSRYKTCNREKCPMHEPSFREVQCGKYNNRTDENNETISDWVPYFDQDKPCELQCVPRNRNDIEIMDGYVADGTPCRQTLGSRDMCIAGVCYKVGCDWLVGSDLEDDDCGVCGGNGSRCKTVRGIYTKGTTKQSGFDEVAVIPAGSRNVRIEEKVSPGNYISIGSARTKKLLLSGARNATLTEYFVAGSQAIYARDRDWEKVRIPGPISEDIKVYQRIYRGRHRNAGVNYSYTVDAVARGPGRYRYRLSEWSPCSATCGRGRMNRRHECVDERGRRVDPGYCDQQELFENAAISQVCVMPPCRRAHWHVEDWQACSESCRLPGKEPTKRRRVFCVDIITNQPRHEGECELANKPRTTIFCADIPPC